MKFHLIQILDKTFVKELSAKIVRMDKQEMDYCFFKGKWFSNFKRTKKRISKNLIKKRGSKSKFSNEVKKTFPDAELLNVEEEK